MIDHLTIGCTCAGQRCASCKILLCLQAFTTKRAGGVLKRCIACREAKRARRQSTAPRPAKTRKPRSAKITPERIEELRRLPYPEYLKQPEWHRLRAVLYKFAAGRCQLCYTDKQPFHVHHRTYERLAQERISDLILLCADCHKLFHEHRKLCKSIDTSIKRKVEIE